MAQFLDKDGLSHFWDKIKTHLEDNYQKKESGSSLIAVEKVLENSKWILNQSGYSQELIVEGIRADTNQVILISPQPSQMDVYTSFGIRALEQNENTLTFAANAAAEDITIYIVFS